MVNKGLSKQVRINLAKTILPEGFDWAEYMKICIPMLSCCDVIILLDGWQNSKGAKAEMIEAVQREMRIVFQSELHKLTDLK